MRFKAKFRIKKGTLFKITSQKNSLKLKIQVLPLKNKVKKTKKYQKKSLSSLNKKSKEKIQKNKKNIN